MHPEPAGDSFGDYWRYAKRRWREPWARLQWASAVLLLVGAMTRDPVFGIALLVAAPPFWALLYPIFRWQVHRQRRRAAREDRQVGV